MRLAVITMLALIPVVWLQCARDAHLNAPPPVAPPPVVAPAVAPASPPALAALPPAAVPSGSPVIAAAAPTLVAPAPSGPAAPSSPAQVPAPTAGARREVAASYDQAYPLHELHDGDALRFSEFALVYRGQRKLGPLTQHVFATTNQAGKLVELPVLAGAETAIQLGGVLYRLETRRNALKVSKAGPSGSR